MPDLTSTLYPPGDYEFRRSYDDDLSGLPVREGAVLRDYLDRLRRADDLDDLDAMWMRRDYVRRPESPDVDP